VQTKKLEFACPVCGSREVYYTCTPNCCFNHVCGDCGTTFEPVTTASGRKISGCLPPDPLPEATDPTAGCAKCDATTVFQGEGDWLVCLNCGAELTLEFTEIAAGGAQDDVKA